MGNASDFLYLIEVRTMDITGSGICSRGYKLLLSVVQSFIALCVGIGLQLRNKI